MRRWSIGLNTPHIKLWVRGVAAYLVFVGVCLVLGANLHPRTDEILFAITLPAWVVGVYAIACGVAAFAKLRFVGWYQRRRFIGSFIANLRLRG